VACGSGGSGDAESGPPDVDTTLVVARQALDDDPVYLAKVIRHRLPDTF
jgi:hypothetical protein